MLARLTVLALVAAALVPAAASAAARPQPLVDLAPSPGATVDDRVLPTHASAAHASQAGPTYRAYGAPDGTSIAVAFSPAYGDDPSVAQTYVDFLDTLPHGSELSALRVYIAPPDEVRTACGGQDGVLACYSPTDRVMVVPGAQGQAAASAGVTTSYVITHEYGHHVAAFRSNAPFPTLDYGPKYWSSYERVCDRTLAGKLAPGDEALRYLVNPGESWAETYARLKYPEQPWTFTSLLRPDAGALGAARRDVAAPWRHGVTHTFSGRFATRRASVRRYTFTLRLDGRLTVRLKRPGGSSLQLAIISGGKVVGTTPRTGGSTITFRAACRQRAAERITLRVRRYAGAGKFSVALAYPG